MRCMLLLVCVLGAATQDWREGTTCDNVSIPVSGGVCDGITASGKVCGGKAASTAELKAEVPFLAPPCLPGS